jgi:hypothetical protein
MAYVEVDVDLNEFDTDELVRELCWRFKEIAGRKKIKDDEKKRLNEELQPLITILNLHQIDIPSITTLEDKMKMEVISSIWNKYTLSQLEEKLK